MYGAISGRGWRSPHLQEPSAPPTRSQARIGVPKSCLQKTLPRFFCALPGRGWYPHASAEPSARPACSQIRISVPRSRPRKHAAKDFSRSTRRFSWTRGHYPCLQSPLLEPLRMRSLLLAPSASRCALVGTTRVFGALSSSPPSPAEPPARPEHSQPRIGPSPRTPLRLRSPPARPERSQTRIGVPKSHPQKHTANFFFCDLIGAVPGRGGTYPRLRSLPLDPPHFQPRLGVGGISKFALGAISVQSPRPGIHSDVYPPPLATMSTRWASTTPPYLFLHPPRRFSLSFILQPHLVLDSLALSRISLAPCQKFSLPSLSSCTTSLLPPTFLDLTSHNNPQQPQAAMSHHQSNKAKFLTYRATHPYAKEGPGWCYNVAYAADVDIAQHAAGTLTNDTFLARMKWKVGHTNDWQRRQREYRGCDVGKTHIWICGWENAPTQLEELCDGGECATINCVCGVSHRKYFSFTTVGGFAEFSALMTRVITYMNEQPTCSFFDPPSTSTSARNIYNLILRS
ncbi:hypothetical protein B0H14DRAFT_3506683 [Mycena olivaceomarginata]|nr:hypothetical protein B0H14DRAFT_3506683 [Mycena olivaceomarginata]